jgi:hypothetical protein
MGRCTDYVSYKNYGIVGKNEEMYFLEITQYRDEPCNCHPETCCCSGTISVSNAQKYEIINTENIRLGDKLKYEFINSGDGRTRVSVNGL